MEKTGLTPILSAPRSGHQERECGGACTQYDPAMFCVAVVKKPSGERSQRTAYQTSLRTRRHRGRCRHGKMIRCGGGKTKFFILENSLGKCCLGTELS